MKWRRWLLVSGLIVVGVVGSVLSYRVEPRYDGKMLSTWLRTYRERGGWRRDEAFIAVRAIGTNAIPSLMSDLRYEVPAWKMRMWGSVSRVLARGPIVVRQKWSKLMPENNRRPLALAGFEILGPYASPAVPDCSARWSGRALNRDVFGL